MAGKDKPQMPSENISCPAYISIDIGLRQKRAHYSGRLYFQAILLQDDFFQNGEKTTNKKYGGKGTRLAEGGRYDDLVRQVSIYVSTNCVLVLAMRYVLNTCVLVPPTWQFR